MKLQAVYLDSKGRRPVWRGVWRNGAIVTHAALPLDPGASKAEALAYALDHGPTASRDAWLAERARPLPQPNPKDGNP